MISDTTTKILTPRPLPTSKTPFDHNKIENGFFFASKTPNNITAFELVSVDFRPSLPNMFVLGLKIVKKRSAC